MKYFLGAVSLLLLFGAGCARTETIDVSVPSATVVEPEASVEDERAPSLLVPAPGFEGTVEEMIVEERDSAAVDEQTSSDDRVEKKVETKQSSVKAFTLAAQQWEFTPSIITVDEGDTVRLTITSMDVTHGFLLPAFDVDEQLEPGKTITVEFVADTAGTYSFRCNVFCGTGHAGMTGTLIVR